MPKSGFKAAARRSAKAKRHNPLARAATGSSHTSGTDQPSSSSAATASTSTAAGVLPLLNKLQLPPSAAGKGKTPAQAPTSTVPPSETIWALASISLLSSSRSSRKQLLAPGHKLIPRILHALASEVNFGPVPTTPEEQKERRGTTLEVKREASGALRNLCIEAGYDDVRLEIARQGGIEILIQQLSETHALIHQALSQGNSTSNGEVDQEKLQQQIAEERKKLEQALPTAEKPLEQMNRKERRHAAKAQAILQQQQNGGATGATSDTSQAAKSQVLANLARDALASDTEVEKVLLELQDNLITIIWCLSEASEDLAIALSRHAPMLSRTLAGYVRLAITRSSSPHEDEETQSKKATKFLVQQVGVSSANALCMLSDENPAFARVLSGVQMLPEEAKALQKSLKGSSATSSSAASISSTTRAINKKELIRLEISLQAEINAHAGLQDLSALADAAALGTSELVGSFAGPKDEAKLNLSMLSMLSAATLRNVSASLPASARSRIFVQQPSADGTTTSAKVSLASFERHSVLPNLAELLQSVQPDEIRDALVKASQNAAKRQQQEQGEKNGAPLDPTQSVLEALNKREGSSKKDAEMEDETAGEEAENDSDDVSKEQKRVEDVLQIILLALEILAEAVPALAGAGSSEDSEGGEEAFEEEAEWMEEGDDGLEEMDAEMEDLVAEDHAQAAPKEYGGSPSKATKHAAVFSTSLLAALFAQSTLPAELIRLAAGSAHISHSFPSAPSDSPAVDQHDRKAAESLRQIQLRASSVLSNLLLSLAAAGPPPPSQPPSSDAERARIDAFIAWSTGDGVRARFNELWGHLFSLALRTAEASAASEQGSSEKKSQESSDGIALVESCIGSMWAIARCMQGVLPAQPDPQGPSIINALEAAYLSAQNDAMRAKTIGTLGCLARAPNVGVETNRSVGNFLINVIKHLPADGKPRSPSDTSPESMVAALNAIYDVYADENAAYDAPVFRQGGYLQALRQCSGKVRATARAVDRRKYASLRSAADEAHANLIAFVQYRDSLGL